MSLEVMIHDVVDKSFWDFRGKVDYVDEWFMMRTPASMILLTSLYLLFVLKLGPQYMNYRPAFNLTSVLAAYNVAQVALSCYLCYIGSKLILSNGLISTSCLMEKEDTKLVVTASTYVYFVAKCTELLDTIFFVLRKNFRQITFLHLYHHTSMVWLTWLCLKYEPSYSTVFLGTLNSYVHVVMYTYYGLSSFPSLAKYLWWKKYITKMQITQFIIIILQVAAGSAGSGCPPSNILLAVILFNALLFTALFTKFYFQAYRKNKREANEMIKPQMSFDIGCNVAQKLE